ncbi:unnamed protein product [Fusarium graminearum]|nr:unnamed protein product [Fusarium graminearum]
MFSIEKQNLFFAQAKEIRSPLDQFEIRDILNLEVLGVTNQINPKNGQIYFPFIYTLFIFILINNLMGMVNRSLYILSLFISNMFEVSGLHNIKLLEAIQRTFKTGKIYKHGVDSMQYRNLQIITDHFDSYPLISQKRADYLLFKQAIAIIKNKEHLSLKGILKGFIDAEGSFQVITQNNRNVSLRFSLTQHIKDEELLKDITTYLNCGRYYKSPGRDEGQYLVTIFSDINDKLIPFLNEYPLLGIKQYDYLDFAQIAELIKSKAHLTDEGLEKINFASTAHFALTFALSFTIVLGATILGFQKHGLKFFSLLVPAGCPLALLPLLVTIEFISYLARNVSLGLRLAANITAGHMLLSILSGFVYNIMNSGFIFFILGLIPLLFIIAFSGLELAIAFIQAQVCKYLARNVSLGLRLAAGHMLLSILSGFVYNIMNSGFIFFILGLIPLLFIIAFSGLELAIAFIQAQVGLIKD